MKRRVPFRKMYNMQFMEKRLQPFLAVGQQANENGIIRAITSVSIIGETVVVIGIVEEDVPALPEQAKQEEESTHAE